MLPDVDRLSYWLLKKVDAAIQEYQMIQPGDRVAVAVSGGKDSLSLLRLLDARRRDVRHQYDLVGIHVLGDGNGPQAAVHLPLGAWLAQSGIFYEIVPLTLPQTEAPPLKCQRCTWHRRRTLFEAAHRLGCNVVAFGHHADDLAQTTLLNLLYHGNVETMAPERAYFGGLLRLVRPLCYLEESALRRYARASQFPEPPPACPVSEHSRRRMVADLLRQASHGNDMLRTNLLRAGLQAIYPERKIRQESKPEMGPDGQASA